MPRQHLRQNLSKRSCHLGRRVPENQALRLSLTCVNSGGRRTSAGFSGCPKFSGTRVGVAPGKSGSQRLFLPETSASKPAESTDPPKPTTSAAAKTRGHETRSRAGKTRRVVRTRPQKKRWSNFVSIAKFPTSARRDRPASRTTRFGS